VSTEPAAAHFNVANAHWEFSQDEGNMGSKRTCPICKSDLADDVTDQGNRIFVNCPACGHFGLTRFALSSFEDTVSKWPGASGLLSYYIRIATQNAPLHKYANTPVFEREWVEGILAPHRLPTPKEQSANFVRWLGDSLSADNPAKQRTLKYTVCASIMGAANAEGAIYVIKFLVAQELLSERSYIGDQTDVGLTFRGWEFYDELSRTHSEGLLHLWRCHLVTLTSTPSIENISNRRLRSVGSIYDGSTKSHLPEVLTIAYASKFAVVISLLSI
jgi:hypothetical protein